jgi:hypothetical protein
VTGDRFGVVIAISVNATVIAHNVAECDVCRRERWAPKRSFTLSI